MEQLEQDHQMLQTCLLQGTVREEGGSLVVTNQEDGQGGIACAFPSSWAVGLQIEDGARYILPFGEHTQDIACSGDLWVLPSKEEGKRRTIRFCGQGEKHAWLDHDQVRVILSGREYAVSLWDDRPACDIDGHRLALSFEQGETLEKTFACFYWDTMLPSVIEKTDALGYPVSEGFVLSTLAPNRYAGTYPDVDHEFQCKGRVAVRSQSDLAVVRHMLDLQFRLMREDPARLWRNPCAIQPNGDREYHVRRDSLDKKANAEMFLISGNVEVLETSWLYFAATKDEAWLRVHIGDLEGAASLIRYLTDAGGRLWSDVFYEDQVIKDGMECMSASLAAHSLKLLVELERTLGRESQAQSWQDLSLAIHSALAKDVPDGFWDDQTRHFVDWIDRDGQVHDHIHLLANCLPVLFGFANERQQEAAEKVIADNFSEFQRFPTFLSPCIADYTRSEIGSGGPYDLCAAGRYWCWDAAYWAYQGRGDVLYRQLLQVAAQAKLDDFRMGERYDMKHVYYRSGKNWHGAPHYYEYPCVFTWVLLHTFLDLQPCLDADLLLKPALCRWGTVEAEGYGIRYDCHPEHFELWNTSGRTMTVRVDLNGVYPDGSLLLNHSSFLNGDRISLDQGQSAVWHVSGGVKEE